jgi:hypothetical protein
MTLQNVTIVINGLAIIILAVAAILHVRRGR